MRLPGPVKPGEGFTIHVNVEVISKEEELPGEIELS